MCDKGDHPTPRVNAQEWGCFLNFLRADDVTRTMSKGGRGACEKSCIRAWTPPPPFKNPGSAPALPVGAELDRPMYTRLLTPSLPLHFAPPPPRHYKKSPPLPVPMPFDSILQCIFSMECIKIMEII